MMSDFGRLLAAIGMEPSDRVTVSYLVPGGLFTATVGTATDAPARVRPWVGRADVWFGVCPLRPSVVLGAGRGKVADIARIPALWADLDAKPGPAGLGSTDGCRRAVDALSAVLRAQPVAVVSSGTGGLHPYWRLTPYPAADHGRAVSLLRRWGVLVRAVATELGGGADNVFDATRVLRVPGTTNKKPGGGQVTVVFTEDDEGTELDVLTLDQLAEALDLAGIPDEPTTAEDGPVVPVAEWAPGATTCPYAAAMVTGWATDRPTAGRHQWLLRHAVRLAAARRLGCLAAADVQRGQDALTAAFTRIVATVPPVRPVAPRELSVALSWGVAKVETKPEEAVWAELGGHTHRRAGAGSGTALAALGRLLGHLREWQHLPDPIHVVATLAAAATRAGEGEPCWLLLVAPPSSGKTEAVRILDNAADARLDEVTAAGLLGWSKAKTAVPSGVLTRCGPRALVTFGDLSSLLATSDRGGRDQVFGLLRRAYDGHVTRDVSPPGRTEGSTQLSWSGRLTVVACVTGAIDRYAAHSDQLGARWLYVRIPDRTLAEKRYAAQLARRGGLADLRKRAREDAAAILEAARTPDTLPAGLLDSIEDAALVTAWGRAAVPRNGYGRREIEGVPITEEPMRLVQQLGAIAGGVLALGLPEAAAALVTRQIALDSMPAARHAVLAALATGEVLTTAGVARTAGLDRKVARFNLEELAAVGVVENDRADDEQDELTGTVHWSLAGAEGAIIAGVFTAARAAGGWDETWGPTPHPPQKGETGEAFTGVQPTLRPTPAEPLGVAS